jgi:hypothetical protein
MITNQVKRIVHGRLVRTGIVLGIVLMSLLLSVSQVDSALNASGYSSAVVPDQAVVGNTPSFMSSNMPALPFSYPTTPLLTAQYACQQMPGWQWRSGGGFTMCFKNGVNLCPAGYPWIRQTTARYTICVYTENMNRISESGMPR